jgi:predicted RNA binding protein YcfA (HicA-like mRNA interferase family)
MTVKDILKLLKKDGWYIARQKGSHRQLKHPTKTGLITVAGNMSDVIKKGTLGSILRMVGLK